MTSPYSDDLFDVLISTMFLSIYCIY